MRVAFATCSAHPEGWPDDREAARLVGAEFAVWDDPSVEWGVFDRVVLRSTWDYTQRAEGFVAWCERVGAERLRNPPALVALNADKRYLRELGAPTVATTFVEPGDPQPDLDGEVVVKPNVSAGARNTGRFGPAAHDEAFALVDRIRASGRTALVQPYLPSVDAAGETALVFLAGELSHVLHKRAVLRDEGVAPVAPGELEVAAAMLEDDLVTAGEATAAQVALAEAVLAELTTRFGTPLYARVDLVEADGAPVLMELEAVEPCLYLDLHPGAAERFAGAILAT